MQQKSKKKPAPKLFQLGEAREHLSPNIRTETSAFCMSIEEALPRLHGRLYVCVYR